jgi:hypothetical protein
MVSITRTLTLKEYGVANSLALANGTAKHRRNNFLFLKYGLHIGVLLLFLGFLIGYYLVRSESSSITFPLLLVWIGVMFLLQPWILRRKIKKLFLAQQLDRPWTVSASEDGVQSKLPGLADTHLEWGYFTTFAETEEMFVLINSRRPAFISFPKRELDEESLVQLRDLARANLPASLKNG